MEGEGQRTAVIFLGGSAPSREALSHIDPHVVIAADSGYAHARGLGIEVHVLIGDLDSIAQEDLAHAESAGAQIVTAPREKDQTDTELAIDWAVKHGFDHVHLVYGGGDRFDHHLGAVNSMSNPTLAGKRVTASIGKAQVYVMHGPTAITITADIGTSVGLIPVGGDAVDVTTSGLRWPLDGETLHSWSSRGVSNLASSREIEVTIRRGVLFVIIHGEVEE